MKMKIKGFCWFAFLLALALPLLYPVSASTTITACKKSPDGGAYSWAQVSQPAIDIGSGIAKVISYKGPGAHAWFWVQNNGGGWLLKAEHVFTGSGQTWTITYSLTGGVYGAEMQTYDGGDNYLGRVDVWATQSGPSPPCTGPQQPLP